MRDPAAHLEEDPRWREKAKCAQIGGDLWFTEDNVSDSHKLRRAVKICGECPVAAQCLQAGMNERHGVWGGFTPAQRAAMRRAAEKKATGGVSAA